MCRESLINYLATELEGKVKKEGAEELIKISDSSVEHDTVYQEKRLCRDFCRLICFQSVFLADFPPGEEQKS